MSKPKVERVEGAVEGSWYAFGDPSQHPEWRRSYCRTRDGREVLVPAAVFGPEETIAAHAYSCGYTTVTKWGHGFVALSWASDFRLEELLAGIFRDSADDIDFKALLEQPVEIEVKS